MVDRELLDQGERPDGIQAGVFLWTLGANVLAVVALAGLAWWLRW